MRSRYAPLAPTTGVLRLAQRGKDYFPAGVEKPLPKWLEPTTEDKQEAQRSGRPAGLSVWDVALSTPASACWFGNRSPADQESFVALASVIIATGVANQRTLAVVADPLPHPETDPRWPSLDEVTRAGLVEAAEGHSLIEGIARPSGVSKTAHAALLDALCGSFHSSGG